MSKVSLCRSKKSATSGKINEGAWVLRISRMDSLIFSCGILSSFEMALAKFSMSMTEFISLIWSR